jgi:glutamyl-tRNA synthetase
MNSVVRVRFAPSPTGALHLGNARTALMNWLFARHHAGVFVLRLDDTDAARTQAQYVDGIFDDLRWLGLDWDETFAQSERFKSYSQSLESLRATGHVYPCWETAQELQDKREAQLAKGLPPIYDRQSLLAPQDFDQSRPVHWRFKLAHQEVTWKDLIQGPMSYHTEHLSDPVVMREDGAIGYMLSSVIDDHDYRISHILRGCDHLTNTAIQIQMFQALGGPLPEFAHFPLMLDASGSKVSKRAGSTSINQLRQDGIWPMAICKALAEFGCAKSYGDDLASMVQDFSLATYSKSSSAFGHDWIVQRHIGLLQGLSWDSLQAHLQDLGPLAPVAPLEISPQLWAVIAPCLTDLGHLGMWASICKDDAALGPMASDPRLVDAALAGLEGLTLDEQAWSTWIDRILASQPDLNKKTLCMTLRLVLTGQNHGPKMHDLLPLIDRRCVVSRLERARLDPS